MSHAHCTAYAVALDALDRGRFVLCIPGMHEGEQVVSTVSYEMTGEHAEYLYAADSDIRACYLLGALTIARDQVAEHGVTPVG